MPPAICVCTLNSLLAFGPYLSNSDAEGLRDPRISDFATMIASDDVQWESNSPRLSYDELLRDVFFWVSRNPGMDADDVAEEFGISLREAIDVTEDLLQQGLLDFA